MSILHDSAKPSIMLNLIFLLSNATVFFFFNSAIFMHVNEGLGRIVVINYSLGRVMQGKTSGYGY